MAKKVKTEPDVVIEEAVASVQTESVESEIVKTEEPKSTTVKPRTVIANEPTAFRKTVSLENKYITGNMSIGVAYEIKREVSSKIYGDFYQLANGYYITKNGNYSIN